MKQNQLWLTGGLDNFHPSMICSHLQQQPHLGLQVQTTVTHLGYTVTPLAHFFSDVSPLSGWRPISDWYRNTILWWSELQGIQLLKLSCMFGVSQFFFFMFYVENPIPCTGLAKIHRQSTMNQEWTALRGYIKNSEELPCPKFTSGMVGNVCRAK